MDSLKIIHQFEFYHQAPATLKAEIAAAASPASLEKGDFFFNEGYACPQFGLVGAGDIRVFKVGQNGREITLYHVHEGQTCLVNMLCAFLSIEAPASARAETPVQAVLFPAAAFRQWIRTSDAVRDYAFKTMTLRLLDVMALVEEVALRRMDSRLADFLLKRFDSGGCATQTLSITHEEIARELGSAREVVSRLLKEFERLGAVRIGRGQLELSDPTVLHGLCSPRVS